MARLGVKFVGAPSNFCWRFFYFCAQFNRCFLSIHYPSRRILCPDKVSCWHFLSYCFSMAMKVFGCLLFSLWLVDTWKMQLLNWLNWRRHFVHFLVSSLETKWKLVWICLFFSEEMFGFWLKGALFISMFPLFHTFLATPFQMPQMIPYFAWFSFCVRYALAYKINNYIFLSPKINWANSKCYYDDCFCE